MYIFEVHLENIDTGDKVVKKIEIEPSSLYETELDIYFQAMLQAYHLYNDGSKNKRFVSLELISR